MPRPARAPMISAGTQGGQGASRPARGGRCSTWTGRPAILASSRTPRARFSAGTAAEAGGRRVIVDTGSQSDIRGGMPEGRISYRHDIGAWLNAAEDHARGATPAGRPAPGET